MPYNLDEEKAILAEMMPSRNAVTECEEVLRPGDYYLRQHETIHTVIVDRHHKGLPNDYRLLTEDLKQRGLLQSVGGEAYLVQIWSALETGSVAQWYALDVRRKAILRRLIQAGMHITEMGFEGSGEIDELLAQATQEITVVAEGAISNDEHDFVLPEQAMADVLDRIEKAANLEGISGLRTGYTDFDELTQGLQPGQLVVVAGRPGMGKSTWAMDVARCCAIEQGIPAAFISLEMPVTELLTRCLSAEGPIALHHLRSWLLTKDDAEAMDKATPRIYSAPLYINDSERTYTSVQAKLRRLKAKQPDLGLVVIDYIQLLTLGGGRRTENRQQEVTEISNSLKMLAKELNLPVVALAQLNRGPEARSDKKPMVSDLRESGSIENDADIVVLLYRDDAYEAETPRAGEVDLIVGKHRNGPTSTITVASQLHYSRFVDMGAF